MHHQLEIEVGGSNDSARRIMTERGNETINEKRYPAIYLNGHRFVLDAELGPGFDRSVERDIEEIQEIIREHQEKRSNRRK